MSSDKSFLIIFSIIFLLVFFYTSNNIFLFISTFVFLMSFVKPNILHLLNYSVFKLGLMIMIIMQPIIKMIVYVSVFGTVGRFKKIFGYDPLSLKKGKNSSWISKKQSLNNLKRATKQF